MKKNEKRYLKFLNLIELMLVATAVAGFYIMLRAQGNLKLLEISFKTCVKEMIIGGSIFAASCILHRYTVNQYEVVALQIYLRAYNKGKTLCDTYKKPGTFNSELIDLKKIYGNKTITVKNDNIDFVPLTNGQFAE